MMAKKMSARLSGIFMAGMVLMMYAISAAAAPVPDTGVTLCYDTAGNIITCPSPGQDYYGQDANYTINPMSYTKLDSNGSALPDSATSWSMVKDNVTGLMWEVKTNSDGKANYNDPHDADNTYPWYDSNPATNGGYAGTYNNGQNTEAFIKALNDAHYGGYSDWRMPTIKELVYIVNYSIASPGPTINTAYFPNTVSSFYWSSSTDAHYTDDAWGVLFSYGYDADGNKADGYYVRAVRGGQSGTFGNSVIGSFDLTDAELPTEAGTSTYTDNGNGTVTDNSTGLMWQQATAGSKMTWKDALSYCENLNLAGHTDWRLPTIKELHSLVDYSIAYPEPTINTAYFPNAVSSGYWSSSTYAGNTYGAWGVDFSNGGDGDGNKSYGHYVRAVRGGQGSTKTACAVTLNSNLAFTIPYLSFNSGQMALSANFSYNANPTYPSLIIFKLTNYSVLDNPSFTCTPSTLSADLSIHIPDLTLPDGVTHLWVDLTYNPALSTDGNFYWVVTNYGAVAN